MTINMIDYSTAFSSSTNGIFHEKVETNNRSVQRTNPFIKALKVKNGPMDNNNFIEELRSLLRSRFDNDIDKLAKCMGRPADDIRDFMDGKKDIPPGFFEGLTDCLSKKGGDKIQFGDKYVEINNSGEGYTNNYSGIMKGAQVSVLKEFKSKISELEQIIEDKDEIIKSKDELIEVLKKQLNLNG